MKQENVTDRRIVEAFVSRPVREMPGAACPDPESVWRAVRRELPHQRIREIGLHVTLCPACAEAWRLAREVAGAVPADVLSFSESPRRKSRKRTAWLGGALAAAAAVVLLALWLPSPPLHLGSADGPLRGGPELVRPSNDLSLPLERGHCELRWEGPPDARWDVVVATEELRVIAEAHDLSEEVFVVPEQALKGMAPGSRIVWQVQATLPDGRRITSRSYVQTLE